MRPNIQIFLVIILIGFASSELLGQNIRNVDSLLNVLKTAKDDTIKADILYDIYKEYSRNNLEMSNRYLNLTLKLSEQLAYNKGMGNAYNGYGNLYKDKGDFLTASEYYKKSLEKRIKSGDLKGQASIYHNMGIVFFNQGNNPEALESYSNALKIRSKIRDSIGIASTFSNIGQLYGSIGDSKKALENFFIALSIFKKLGNVQNLSRIYTNIGVEYGKLGKFNNAIQSHRNALQIFETLGDKFGATIAYQNIGAIQLNLNEYSEALNYFMEALKLCEEIGDNLELSSIEINIGNTLFLQKKYTESLFHLNRAMTIANLSGKIEDIYESNLSLSKLYSAQANYQLALEHFKTYVIYRDSVFNDENTKKITQQQMQYEFDKKEAAAKAEQEKKDRLGIEELKKQKLVRNVFVGGFALVTLFAGVFFTQRNKIKKGKKRSDELLLNILPEEVAEELKEKGSAEAKQFDEVTVMFTDFKGFTQVSERLSPAALVSEIHTCFKAFDAIITKYNIEKIKTIGDSYMCAGGLPVINKTHADDVVKAALEIRDFMQNRIQTLAQNIDQKEVFEIRIGIHTGTVIAGIVGVKKFAYDIWGDTVNIASRMESSGEAGKVNISGRTYELVKDKFKCVYRGKLNAKNKGEIDMYFVEG